MKINFKHLLGSFIVLTCLVLLLPAAASASTLKLNPASGDIDAGKDVVVDIVITGDNELIDGVDTVISYDTAYLSLKDTKQGNFFGTYPVVRDDNGKVTITALAPKEGVKIFGDITIATLTFEVVDSGTAKIEMLFDKASTKDSNVPLHGSNGQSLTAVAGGEYNVVASPENLQKAAKRKASGQLLSPFVLFVVILILIAIAVWYWLKNRKPRQEVYTPEPFPMDRPPTL